MFDKKFLNYDILIKKEKEIVEYLIKNSDFFSITAIIKKPYSQIPPVFNYSEQFIPFVEKYIFDKQEWSIDFLGQRKHQIMVVCRCCKESSNVLAQMPNVFLPIENNAPEDICFYRNGKVWFATISHEKITFLQNPTEKDKNFFEAIGS